MPTRATAHATSHHANDMHELCTAEDALAPVPRWDNESLSQTLFLALGDTSSRAYRFGARAKHIQGGVPSTL